jgi:hypothetical protein
MYRYPPDNDSPYPYCIAATSRTVWMVATLSLMWRRLQFNLCSMVHTGIVAKLFNLLGGTLLSS